jgi:hypothetical protein
VKVNSTKSKHFTVQNAGKFPLEVTVGSLTAPFTVTAGSGSFTLAKSKKKTVTIEFEPTTAGASGPVPSQILSITSDDPLDSSHPVTVAGSEK